MYYLPTQSYRMAALGLLFFCLAWASPVLAQDTSEAAQLQYVPLSNIPALNAAADAAQTGEFSILVNVIYKLAISIGSAIAVIMIIAYGVQYSASAIPGVKEGLRGKLLNTLGGLALLVCAYLLLNFINPNLTKFDEVTTGELQHTEESLQINQTEDITNKAKLQDVLRPGPT